MGKKGGDEKIEKEGPFQRVNMQIKRNWRMV